MGLRQHATRTALFGLNKQSLGVKDHSQPQDTWSNQVFRPLWQGSEASGMQSERRPKAYSYTRFSTPEQAMRFAYSCFGRCYTITATRLTCDQHLRIVRVWLCPA